MPNKWGRFLAVLALSLGLLGAWFAWRLRQASVPQPPLAVASAEATPSATAPGLEKAVRSLMPGAGLFRDDWLRKDSTGWNLHLPRRRYARALSAYFKSGLQRLGLSCGVFEDRDFSQWRGFYLEAGGEKLTAVQDKGPALAVVIDDWGYHTKVLAAMRDFPLRLTASVLPGLPHSGECAEAAFAAGHEVILHLPMEPERKMPMLPGTIVIGMPLDEVSAWIGKHAATVPHMLGLNNHEGSKASADANLMGTVAAWLKQHGGYFLDSKTSAASVGEAEARRAGIPYESRRVFLDNVDRPADIEKYLRQAIAIARRTGSCIAIGHPRKNTFDVLAKVAPELEGEGVDMVRASELTLFDMGKPHD